MSRGDVPTPFYLRTQHGETFFVDWLDEALREFAGDDGYRLTITTDEIEVVFRRGVLGVTQPLGELEAEATVTVRRKSATNVVPLRPR